MAFCKGELHIHITKSHSCDPKLCWGRSCCHPESWELSLTFRSSLWCLQHKPYTKCYVKNSMDSRRKVLIQISALPNFLEEGAQMLHSGPGQSLMKMLHLDSYCASVCDFVCLNAQLSGLLRMCQHESGSPARNHEKKWLPFCSLIKICPGCSATWKACVFNKSVAVVASCSVSLHAFLL